MHDAMRCLGPQAAIMGHSMGGHGALVLGLRNPELYKSISAFSPIANPSAVPWGEKAFSGYLGSDREAWKQYDATELVRTPSEAPPLSDVLSARPSPLHSRAPGKRRPAAHGHSAGVAHRLPAR